MEVIVGTAGHIDHGKTALVKALTGVDADRLPEEKRRGITVDLGFAEMSLGDVHIGFVDVPGHEGFVKNMLAGASGIDIVMLVIAATEGVMPQTREHFDICRLLGVTSGVIVLTKADIADAETLELAKLDAAELVADSFLAEAPVICVSARTGEGIESLKEALRTKGSSLPVRNDRYVTRLPIDRSFSMKGFGAVVTGTLASGEIVEGTELRLLPSGSTVRVRGVQTHGQTAKSVCAGRRVAVNLGGIDHSRITRGMVLVEPNALLATQMLDAEIEVLAGSPKPLRSRQRLRIHIGTKEALARVQVLNVTGQIDAGAKDFVQIRLEEPVVAIPGERFIVRRYSPQTTIAGGEVIDTFAKKHRRGDIETVRTYLSGLLTATGDAEQVRFRVAAAGPSGLSLADLQHRTGLSTKLLASAISGLKSQQHVVEAGASYVHREAFEKLTKSTQEAVESFHKREPLAKGISREALAAGSLAYLPGEIFQSVLASLESAAKIVLEKDSIRISSFQTKLSSGETEVGDKILARYREAKLEVPKLESVLADAVAGTKFYERDARKFFQLFLDSGEIVKVTDDFYFARGAIDELIGRLKQFAAASADRLIDVSAFKEMAGISRKYAIPLLEYFDRERITTRSGDKRLIR